MISLLEEFINDLRSLYKLISFNKLEINLLDVDLKFILVQHNSLILLRDHLEFILTQKRVYDYNTIIVSLYGFFEQFIENILISFTKSVSQIFVEPKHIPEIIQTNHYKLSIELLLKIEEKRKSKNLPKAEILKNIYNISSNNNSYKLNGEAFAQHTANFGNENINDMFMKLGIDTISKSICEHSPMREYLRTIREEAEINVIKPSTLLTIVDDLADKRNDVAHGVRGEILQSEILEDYLKFFMAYAPSLVGVLNNVLYRMITKNQSAFLGKPSEVLKAGTVVIFNNQNKHIKRGDYFLFENANEILLSKVNALMFDNFNITAIKASADCEISILVTVKVKRVITFI